MLRASVHLSFKTFGCSVVSSVWQAGTCHGRNFEGVQKFLGKN